MPRKSRIDAPGALHHIIARGIRGENIFHNDFDRNNFLERFENILSESDTQCFAWALMPNHFHLLLKTGTTPLSSVMRRLLTGYAVSHNLRHNRQGHLFQNRYKSILCQEDSYLLELVRYIHLNPLRAGIVEEFKELDQFPYSGHSVLLGIRKNNWQNVKYVLRLFDSRKSKALIIYQSFVQKGIKQGKRDDLIGGGLIRSAGGWESVKKMRRDKSYQKGDERILGDGEFVEQALLNAQEQFEKKYRLQAEGFNLEKIVQRIAFLLDIKEKDIWETGKHSGLVKARSLLCYWAVSKLGISQITLAGKLHISQPAVSMAVKRGKMIAETNRYFLLEKGNL